MSSSPLRYFLFVLMAAVPTAAAPAQAAGDPIADFYKGKTIRIVVAYPPAGAYDMYSRLVARHLGRHIPGNPRVIVQNMPGAGGLAAARAVYTVEPKNGTVIVHTNQFLVLQQAIGQPGLELDTAKFNWLGSAYRSLGHCAVHRDLGITRVQEIMDGKEVHTAVQAPGTFGYDMPAVLNAALGTRFKLVAGYPGLARILAAVESREADAFCTGDPFQPVVTPLLGGEIPVAKVVVILGDRPSDHPMLKGVPPAETLAKTDEAKMLLRTLAGPLQMSLPWAAAPGVPPERLAALRQGMARTFADSRFLAEAEKAQATIEFTNGEDVARIVRGILDAPAPTRARLKEIFR